MPPKPHTRPSPPIAIRRKLGGIELFAQRRLFKLRLHYDLFWMSTMTPSASRSPLPPMMDPVLLVYSISYAVDLNTTDAYSPNIPGAVVSD